MKPIVAAIICGSLDDKRFPGRNTFPLIGRPMVAYPILAAKHARSVDRVYVTTNAPSIAHIAAYLSAEIIARPPQIAGPEVTLEEVLVHGYQEIKAPLNDSVEAIVILLANAPTVTANMIDQGIELLLQDPLLDAVTAVALRNEFNPQYAYTINSDNLLVPHPASLAKDNAPLADAYFDSSVMWVIRPNYFTTPKMQAIKPNAIINPLTQRIRPMVFEGQGDIDYSWQVPGVVDWLRHQGFSEEFTPYDVRDVQRTASLSIPPPVHVHPPKHHDERRVLITTVPFAEVDRTPLDLLESADIEYVINPLNRKLKESELIDLVKDFGVIIAGTEPHTRLVMANAPYLRLISRVGIGLDSVDLLEARKRGILITYTPDAPAPAVAELTIGLMVSLLRAIPQSDRSMRQGVWHRTLGRRLAECTIGLIGCGRVGKRVVKHLQGFSPKRILTNDSNPDIEFGSIYNLEWTDKETIYREADIITFHIPLTHLTQNLITHDQFLLMKPSTVLINTSRGGIINEQDLAQVLRKRKIAAAAIDTYLQEPYSGELTTIENCILTSHMGSMSIDCRCQMEYEATQEVIRYLNGKPLLKLVPDSEYELME